MLHIPYIMNISNNFFEGGILKFIVDIFTSTLTAYFRHTLLFVIVFDHFIKLIQTPRTVNGMRVGWPPVPAFRGTVPKTYVKSRVPHFAWNVPQISFFIIYSTILNFRMQILFRFYVNSVTEYFVPMVLFTKYNIKKYNINNSLSLTWNVKNYMNRISLCLFMAIKFVYFVWCHLGWGRVWTWVYDTPMKCMILSGRWVGNTGCPAKSSMKGGHPTYHMSK
jgi:hypothetical protein